MSDDICFNYHGGNSESNDANRFTNKARDAGRIIRQLLSRLDGLTCDELEVLLAMRHQTCSARCSDLKRARVIIPKPLDPLWAQAQKSKYERRPTRTGRWAAVLVLKNPTQFKR
jgi:hypothetical protein